jgi:LysR family malonate utilization transcriptional regulator
MLREEAIDAAVAVMSDQEAIDDDVLTVELYRDPVMFAAPLDSPYAALDTMDLRLAREQPFVALNQDFITMQAMQPLFDKAGFQPRIALRAGNLFSLANLVAEGVGCGLLPSRVALFNTRLRLIPLTAEFAHWQSIRLVVPRMHERKPNVLALIAECRSLPEANG